MINHNRGYDNNSGQPSATVITDVLWNPIAKPFGPQANEPLQWERSRRHLLAGQWTRALSLLEALAAERLPDGGLLGQLRLGLGIAHFAHGSISMFGGYLTYFLMTGQGLRINSCTTRAACSAWSIWQIDWV